MTRIPPFSPLARAIALGTRPDDLLPELHRELLVAVGGSRSLMLQRTDAAWVPTSGRGFAELGEAIGGAEAAAVDRLVAGGAAVVDLAPLRATQSRLGGTRALAVPVPSTDRPTLLLVADPAASDDAALHHATQAAGEFALGLEWSRLARNAALNRRVQELSLLFARGISSMATLTAALETLTHDANAAFGTARISIWLHERRGRELLLLASSPPADGMEPTRVSSDEPEHPAARGLRLERPELIDAGAARVLLAPLRGWRRALGTLAIELGARADLDPEPLLPPVHDLARALGVAIENVQLLEELLRQRRLLEDTFNSLVDLVVVTDRARRVVQMNEAVIARTGRSRQDLFERDVREVIGDELGTWAAGDEDAAAIARTRTFEALGGTMHVTLTPLINQDGEPVGRVLVARDITVQMRLEAEREALRTRLAQSEKLASLGQFVAGIAHEMNNPLQGVLGHLELLMSTSEAARPIRSELRRIYVEADRAAKIVRNLLVFTGARRMTRRRLRVDRVLSRALASRKASLARHGIEVIRRQDEDVPPITGDPLLLQQAFLNVLINAEHAILDANGERRIEIDTSRSADGQRAVTTMRDTGAGISAEILPRIFDPFFTTKEVGRGTGLGLAITYGIVQEHGGAIHAANAAHGGAVFTIELPVAVA